jgi:hypothetical protein
MALSRKPAEHSIPRGVLLGALLLVACPHSSASPAPVAVVAPALPVLGGGVADFLRVELPAGAQVEPGAPPSDCDAQRLQQFALGGKAYRLVEGRMGRTVAAPQFPVMIKKVILAAEDEMAAAEPRFESLHMTTAGMLGTLVSGALPIEDHGWLLLGIAYLRLPAGELFSLELFQKGQADGGGPARLLQTIASSAAPGAMAPTVGPGIYRLPPLQLSLPADYFLECHAGPDFEVYDVRRVQGLEEAVQGHVFFYVGPAPQPQRVADSKDRPDWATGLGVTGLILGKQVTWSVLQADQVIGSTHLGMAFEVGDGERADIRVVCSNATECARLQEIMESLARSG